MKILWKINVIIPQISEIIGSENSNNAGWIEGLYKSLKKNKNIELGIVFPYSKNLFFKKDGVSYFSFVSKSNKLSMYNKTWEKRFNEIIQDFKPELLHVFGTEFTHTLAIIKAFNKPKKTIINIQGLIGLYGNLYNIGLPNRVIVGKSLKDLIKLTSLKHEAKKFQKRGIFEIKAIKSTGNVIGRTDWDEAYSRYTNHKLNYYSCNEVLRSSFYSGKWNINNIEKYSIFLSQGHYPIKGLHFALYGLFFLKNKFPNVKLYISGHNELIGKSIFDVIKRSKYSWFIIRLIKKFNLENNVIFLGNLNEKEMKLRYLKSNVCISTSIIENESNSISEAMLLGVPIVSSYVGGVTNRVVHKSNGFLYPLNEPNMLAFYIEKIFSDTYLATRISHNASITMKSIVNKEKNLKEIQDIYLKIYNS